MSLPQANARLLSVAGGGLSEDFGRDPGADAAKWEGSIGAYYRERRRSTSTAAGRDVVIERTLIVDGRELRLGSGELVELEVEDSLTFSARRDGEWIEQTLEVADVTSSELPAVASSGVATTTIRFVDG